MIEIERTHFQGGEPNDCIPLLIQLMESLNNPIFRNVKFWFNIIFEGYITEIVVETIKKISEVEREFFERPRGKYLKSIKLWIKLLVC